jgi:O-antigen/teichoic acid export membrane protein
MLLQFKQIFRVFFKGHQRSVRAKKNILASFFVKGFSILIGLMMVPIVLDYLDQEKYGIWLTMSSFLGWFAFFEIGLGSGLRNKLAEALAKKDLILAKIYVSTTYGILTIVIGFFSLLFFTINPFLDWTKILNTSPHMAAELRDLAFVVFGFFFLRFIIKLISTILYADQRPALGNIFEPLGKFLSILIIYILIKCTSGSLLLLGATLSISPIIILIIGTIYFFNSDYKLIRPSIKYVKLEHAKSLMSLGIKFFLIQISALVLFQTANIIIAHYFGPSQVTPYNIAHRYFNMINMIFAIIMIPFWSAFTDAYAKNDFDWIKKTVRKLIKIWFLMLLLAILMLIFSDLFFKIWLKGKIEIPFILSLLLALQFILFTFGGVFNMFINGVGKIKLQLISLTIGAVIFFPLSHVFIKIFHLGIEGLVLATIISNFYLPILAPLQYYKIINNTAKGVWNK